MRSTENTKNHPNTVVTSFCLIEFKAGPIYFQIKKNRNKSLTRLKCNKINFVNSPSDVIWVKFLLGLSTS